MLRFEFLPVPRSRLRKLDADVKADFGGPAISDHSTEFMVTAADFDGRGFRNRHFHQQPATRCGNVFQVAVVFVAHTIGRPGHEDGFRAKEEVFGTAVDHIKYHYGIKWLFFYRPSTPLGSLISPL